MSYGDAQWVQQAKQANVNQTQLYLNGNPYYSPVPFNPSTIDNGGGLYPNQEGYLYFGSGYDPNGTSQDQTNTDPSNMKGAFSNNETLGQNLGNWSGQGLFQGGFSNIFGSQSPATFSNPLSSTPQTNQLGTAYLGIGDQNSSGSDAYMYEPFFYNNDQSGAPISSGNYQGQTSIDPKGSYGGLVGQTQISGDGISGIQTANGVQGAGPVTDNVSYSQPSSPQTSTVANPWTEYMFGNNGDQGTIQGTFGQGINGPTTFYQNEPSSLNPAANPALGTFTPWNPSMQALQQSRSQ